MEIYFEKLFYNCASGGRGKAIRGQAGNIGLVGVQ
jgi:hypothetical protein